MMYEVQHPDGTVTRIFQSRYWKCRKCGAVWHLPFKLPVPRPSHKCSCGATQWIRASEADHLRFLSTLAERREGNKAKANS